MICEIAPFSDRPCTNGFHHHHILNASFLANGKAYRFVTKHPDEFLVWSCNGHNTSRVADAKRIRALLMREKVRRFGRKHMEEICCQLQQFYKQERQDLTLDALLSYADEV